jgi:hypothetical protein
MQNNILSGGRVSETWKPSDREIPFGHYAVLDREEILLCLYDSMLAQYR